MNKIKTIFGNYKKEYTERSIYNLEKELHEVRKSELKYMKEFFKYEGKLIDITNLLEKGYNNNTISKAMAEEILDIIFEDSIEGVELKIKLTEKKNESKKRTKETAKSKCKTKKCCK